MTKTSIEIVELVEPACKENGYLHLVRAGDKRYYVSALMGKEAVGMPIGSKFNLTYHSNASMGAYALERIS
jgi:hypothetical protein